MRDTLNSVFRVWKFDEIRVTFWAKRYRDCIKNEDVIAENIQEYLTYNSVSRISFKISLSDFMVFKSQKYDKKYRQVKKCDKKINKLFKKKVRPTLFQSELRMSKPFESLIKSLTLVPFGS